LIRFEIYENLGAAFAPKTEKPLLFEIEAVFEVPRAGIELVPAVFWSILGIKTSFLVLFFIEKALF